MKMRRKLEKREKNERYRFVDFLVDLLFFVPELLFLPIRLLVWMVRPIVRLVTDIF
ncbi:hypothetical protein [Sporosarcina sp. Te-1]|uniref:hypothetical protein n=1 Tax=Sporosarcina sp. Te-1 TaxID=2818390 RepID=UPI001FB13A95|nr:hypothetical protein [Sporosarcina sp. Te-1]